MGYIHLSDIQREDLSLRNTCMEVGLANKYTYRVFVQLVLAKEFHHPNPPA